MFKQINIQNTKKKALDLFDPKVLDRIKTLQKSKKKEAPKKYQPNPAYLSNIYQLGIPHENIKKTLPSPNYYKSSKKTNSKSSISKLPKKNTINRPTSKPTNTIVTINKITPILTQPKIHTQYYSHIPNISHSKPPSVAIQEPINLPRRIHSPKTVWRLLRKQKKKFSKNTETVNNTKKKYKKRNSKTSLKKNTTTTNTHQRQVEKIKINNNTTRNSSKSSKSSVVSKDNSSNNRVGVKTKASSIKQPPTTKNNKTNTKNNTKSKKQIKPTFLMLDKIADVKARYKKRKTIRQNLKKLNRKKIIFYLARRNIVEWNSNAPLKVLKDLYLAARSMGNIYVQKM